MLRLRLGIGLLGIGLLGLGLGLGREVGITCSGEVAHAVCSALLGTLLLPVLLSLSPAVVSSLWLGPLLTLVRHFLSPPLSQIST